MPQLSVPPHPSAIEPQLLVGQVFGVHVCVTQTLFVHVAFTAHVPQLSVPPHPLGMLPQSLPCAEHVIGPPHPSETVPHLLPTPPEPQVIGTHAGWHVPLLVALHVSPDTQVQLR